MLGRIIKHLHPLTRFNTSTTSSFLAIDPPPIRPRKSTSNADIVKVFCGFTRDNASSRSKRNVSLAGRPCYLRLVDRKSNQDFTTDIVRPHSHFQIIDSYEVLVEEDFVWFIQELTSYGDKLHAALETFNRHAA